VRPHENAARAARLRNASRSGGPRPLCRTPFSFCGPVPGADTLVPWAAGTST
jgi:hypothetical protein